jgi:hypothetical protein
MLPTEPWRLENVTDQLKIRPKFCKSDFEWCSTEEGLAKAQKLKKSQNFQEDKSILFTFKEDTQNLKFCLNSSNL